MSEPRQIAVVRSYDELIEALRGRALELGATRKQIAEVAGLPDGYAATLLSEQPVKSLGRTSLGPMLGALGIAMILVEDLEALARVKSRVSGGARSYMLNGNKNSPVTFKLSRRHMAKLVRLMTEGRKRIPAWKRRQIARKAARARWAKPRVTHALDTSPAASPRSVEPELRQRRSSESGEPKGRAPRQSACSRA